MAPRETGNNAYAKSWGGKQRALWYVMVFSGVVTSPSFPLGIEPPVSDHPKYKIYQLLTRFEPAGSLPKRPNRSTF